MGFLERIFSTRNKKAKQPRHECRPAEVLSELGQFQESNTDLTAHRLLRSSSTRFAVISELDSASLPPISHPINNVIESYATQKRSLVDKQHRYKVTVHRDTTRNLLLNSTSIPTLGLESTNLKRSDAQSHSRPTSLDGDKTIPKDQGRLSHFPYYDTSIRDLVRMYDEHGRLDSTIFSNTPPSYHKYSSTEIHQTNSTLRELHEDNSGLILGHPEHQISTNIAKSDVSWADRYLRERLPLSNISSTENGSTDEFAIEEEFSIHSQDEDKRNPQSLLKPDKSSNCLTPSSMEVELSLNSITSFISPGASNGEGQNGDLRQRLYNGVEVTKDQRASQVFSFLTEGWAAFETQTLPSPPASFSSESPSFSRSSPSDPSNVSDTSLDWFSSLELHPTLLRTPSDIGWRSSILPNILDGTKRSLVHFNEPPSGEMFDNTGAPIHTPTASNRGQASFQQQGRPGLDAKFPGGPKSKEGVRAKDPVSTSRRAEADPFTRIPTRRSRIRKLSLKSTETPASAFKESEDPFIETAESRVRDVFIRPKGRTGRVSMNHENSEGSLRPRSLKMCQHAPSPASSSDLSPFAKQIMLKLRERRKRSRQ